jgi:ribonuclease PH
MRKDGRRSNELRELSFERNFIKTAEGSVLVSMGQTKVIVTAKVEKKVPEWMKGKGHGWITAEYSMLPGSCLQRVKREKNQSGRSSEIQRLIGRALRAMVDLKKLPELTIQIDCDVIQADGGTRTASINGAYIAVYDCLRYLQEKEGCFKEKLPILNQVAAISAGIYDGVILDLNYEEDSNAEADANFVLNSSGNIIEIQGTAEKGTFSEEDFLKMFNFAKLGIAQILEVQRKSL